MTIEKVERATLCIGILTHNEERRIKQCIASAAFADQIVVIDSGSTDQTVQVASASGAEVYVYTDWKGFAEQRNRLIKHTKTDYIFFLDADEEITPGLREEILQILSRRDRGAWEVKWDEVAFGRHLNYMTTTGGVMRFFYKADLMYFEGVVHEHAALHERTPIKRLRNRLLHYSRETVYDSLRKLAQYTQLGAAKRAHNRKSGGVLRGIGSASANFFKLYILRRGFLCGPEGFLFCFFIALECFFRYAAIKYDKALLNQCRTRA